MARRAYFDTAGRLMQVGLSGSAPQIIRGAAALSLFWQAADGTGRPEPLTMGGVRPQRPSAFTPDGTALLLSEGGISDQDIALLPLDGEGRRVVPLIATEASEFNAVVSPEGGWLAYQSNESRRFEIWVTSFPIGVFTRR